MENRHQLFENLAHAQGKESAEDDNIAPSPIRSQPSRSDTAGADDLNWRTCNLLSLDGGGIRGYWTLLVLQGLFHYIGNEEENEGNYHSFCPRDWPDHVYQAPLTREEKRQLQEAYDQEAEIRSLRRSRRFLPCHYFDYICGSSTGALIAIMLGRFRMTISDCLFEYRKLGQEVFGKPRKISTLRFGLGVRHKYKAKRLENLFQEVSIRRNERPGPGEMSKITFPSGRGLCATLVTAMKSEDAGRLTELYLVRSYDHDKRDSPDHSTRVTPRPTMRTGRTNTGISTNTNATQRRPERNRSLVHDNYGKASQLEVWQVARAATAAKFYFKPLRIENARVSGGFLELTDGGFGPTNNPTRTGKQEIEDLHGSKSIGIIVSVGTARKKKEDAKKGTFFSTIPNSAREFADQVTDPEVIHREMKRDYERHKEFQYYRLNHPGGLQTELDEWEPKSGLFSKKETGTKTINDIESAFDNWAAKPENITQLQECAAALVACRRGRMETSKWERYATGSHYRCRFRRCDPGDLFDRSQFVNHLQEHRLDGHEFEEEEEVSQCRKHWRYQAASAH